MSIADLPVRTLGTVAAPMRRRLAHTLRSKVAGEDAATKAARIWGSEGPRWFTPGDPVWRVHADASMFVGGVRALLLQSLHPLAMAGVAGHSGYRSDPWGRLERTSAFLATTTFGTIAHAEEAIAQAGRSTSGCGGRLRTGAGTPPATRTSWTGCTWPRSTAS